MFFTWTFISFIPYPRDTLKHVSTILLSEPQSEFDPNNCEHIRTDDVGKSPLILEVNIRDFEGDRFSSLYSNSHLSVELQFS